MSRAARRAAVDGVSVLLLTRPGGPLVDRALDALAAQEPLPDRVVVVGPGADAQEAPRALEHPVAGRGVEVVLRPAPARPDDHPVAASVDAVLDDLPDDPAHWVWVLHDDSRPQPGALAALLDQARRGGRVGVVGPKLVRDDDPRVLVAVGHRVTRAGRPLDDPPGMVDQGQLDGRSDVIGVPLAGLLVRSDVLAEVGGLDPAFDEGTEGLDLCWRAHLRGHRVVVAPQAVVEQGEAGLGTGSPSRHRQRVRQVALARASGWRAPLRAVAVAVGAVLAALGLLLLQRPAEARAELADLGAVLAPARSVGARWRFRGRRRVRERDLRGLFEPAREGRRGLFETMQESVSAGRGPADATVRRRGGVETGPVSDDAVSLGDDRDAVRRRWTWWLPAALVVTALVSSARWSELSPGLAPGGSGVRGGELQTSGAGSGDLWGLWALPWSGSGLGSADPAAPWVLPMTGLTWLAERLPGGPDPASSADVVTAWLLWGAPLLACATAYLAGRVATPRRPLRAAGGVAWAGLAPLAAAVDGGRLGPVAVHVAAPLLLATVVVVADRPTTRGRATVTAACVLATGLAAWFVPAVLLWTSAVAAVLLVLGPGPVRAAAGALLVLPPLLLGPWLADLWREPLLGLGGPGATAVADAVPAWQTLLLHPGGPVTPVLWWTAPLWLLALLATAQAGAPGRRAATALAAALLALSAALAAPWVHLATVPAGYSDAGQPVVLWPGGWLSLTGAGLLLAALVGAEAAWRSARESARPRAGATVLTVTAVVALVASLGMLGWRAAGSPDARLEVATPALPAVVAEQAAGPSGIRLLELVPRGPDASYVVRFQLRGAEPDPWVRDRLREAVLAGAAPVEEAVRGLVDGEGPSTGDDTADGPASALLALAVGYVEVAAPTDHPLVARFDALPGLTRVSTPPGEGVLWRVTEAGDPPSAPARVRVLGPDGGEVTALAVEGPHGVLDAELPVEARGGTLVVSEGPGWGDVAVVRADGAALQPAGGTPPRVDLPGDATTVSVALPVEHRVWWWATALLVAVVAFVALPVGGPRGRSTA